MGSDPLGAVGLAREPSPSCPCACDTRCPQDSADEQPRWGLGSENTNGNYPFMQKTEWMANIALAAGCGLQIPALLWWDYLFFPLLIFPLLSGTSFVISPRASSNTACGFTFLYIIFIMALISVFSRQRTEAKFCPGADIHPLPRAHSGAIGTLCELTEPHECWNPSYKVGTLVLPRTVKCFTLFLSLQHSRKFLNHSETSGTYYSSFYRRNLPILFQTFCLNMQVTMQKKDKAPSDPAECILWCDYLPVWRAHENKGQTAGLAWSPGHCSVQGGTEQPAVGPQTTFALCLENNHSTRPVPDSSRPTSPTVLQPS